ncbi:nucleoid-associated protein [Clostridioides difficile]
MIIHKFIIHVLDKNSDTPILNDFEGRVSQDMDIFFQKKINKVLRDNDIRKAVFNDYSSNLIKKCCEQIIYDESSFLNNSKKIAAYLFDVMKLNATLESCDLAICLYTEKDEKKVAILKLDYNKSYTHSISFEDDKFKTKMFKGLVDAFIANLYSDMKQGEDVRNILLYMLREKQKLDINEFTDKAIKGDLKDSFKDHVEEKGLDGSFNIDKKWVEKNLKNRHIKTDTGIEIKGKIDDFEDFMKYSVRQNQNGSIDIVIKNVSFYEEK